MHLNSGQDGGVSRNPSLPHTTKRRTTTNIKSINNQKCQKIKLHGAPTTKELKKQWNRINRPVRTHGEAVDLVGGAGWTGNWDSELTVDYSGCHNGRNSQSHMSSLESGLELSRGAALFTLWPLPHRQCRGIANRVVLPWWTPKAPHLLQLNRCEETKT